MDRPNAAILFEPDGYVISGPKLMGRQMAGNGFLRAAVGALQDDTLYVYTPRHHSAEAFGKLVAEFDPQARVIWVRPDEPELLSQIGTLYLPGPGLSEAA